MEEREDRPKKVRVPKKIPRIRLQNIALYYLQRFDTSVHKLREVLQKRVNEYARYDKNFDRREADGWIEELLAKFESCHYLDDRRFAENKIRGYLAAGKPRRYIENKLREKGIAAGVIEQCFDEAEYDPRETALNFARKKKLGGFREDAEKRREMRQKDMGTMVRAGFDYDLVLTILDYVPDDDEK